MTTLCTSLKRLIGHPKLLSHKYLVVLRHHGYHSHKENKEDIVLFGQTYKRDEWTNVTPKILSLTERKLHLNPKHPIGRIKQRIVDYAYGKYENVRGNPLFSVHQNLSPVVNMHQNFDSLLVPPDHPSRNKSDSYYLNQQFMLRAHTSAHQAELITMGLDNFLVVGDVYRRDAIDSSHYPAFHQMEGVRLFDEHTFFNKVRGELNLQVFEEDGVRTNDKQETHTLDTAKLLEIDLKDCLLGLAKDLFGSDIEYRWVDCYFPFTHPSWELEILWQGDWMEVLGCGVIEQRILNKSGASKKVGWAFGLGLERLAMKLYDIPDIRIFWSTDPGFLNQFETDNPNIKFKAVSKFPSCTNDLSFWIPENSEELFSENDFYDLVRSVGGDLVEQVKLFDSFYHPKKKRSSQSYRITYRHMDRTLTQGEVNDLHQQVQKAAEEMLGVTIR